jgi:uncharacterized membrane protein (DUF106 family)
MNPTSLAYTILIVVMAIVIGAVLFIAYDIWTGVTDIDEYQDSDNWGAK